MCCLSPIISFAFDAYSLFAYTYITMPATTHRLDLNNYLQKTYKNQTTLTWTQRHIGPEHTSDWEAVALINHEPYGTGTAHLLDEAKELAAHQALVNLRGY